MSFFICGAINVVNNSLYYDFNSPEEGMLTMTISPRVTNALNLYLVDKAAISGGAVAGYAFYPGNNVSTTVCMMNKAYLAAAHNGTLVHEIGHTFNLPHTHNGTSEGNTNANAENVPRTGPGANCATRGDFVCDTEADPIGPTSNCVYTGTATDVLGNLYTPPVNNIMSYYPDECGGIFTPGQYARIEAALVVRQGHTNYNLSCAATAVNAPTALSAAHVGNAIVLNWTDNANNELGYLIERSTTSASSGFSAIRMGGVAPDVVTYSDNSIASNTDYWYRIKSSNGNCNTYSNVAAVRSGVVYCVPTYSNSPYCINSLITNVTMAGEPGFNNNSACANFAYTDYSASISSTVAAGSTYNIAITRSLNYGRYLQVYIDFNQDGDFDDAGEKLFPDNTVATAVYNRNIAIPANAINGSTRMRVMMKNQVTISSACETNMTYGETEDYMIKITGGALPVGLLYFTGFRSEDKMKLDWATSMEHNNKFFVIEKSENGEAFEVLDTTHAEQFANVLYELKNIAGIVVQSGVLSFTENENVYPIDISTLPSGMYYLNITTGRKPFVHRIVKQ